MNTQELFDLTIGRLDHVLSLLVLASKRVELDEANRQTLKHHAEDMIAAGQAILRRLAGVEGTPQPAGEPEKRELARPADLPMGTRVRVLAITQEAPWVKARVGITGHISDQDTNDGEAYVTADAPSGGSGWARRVEVIT